MVATLPENKTQNDEDFFADILAAINGMEIKETEIKPLTLQQNLNNLINRGISFAVKADTFEIAAGAEKLTKTDTDYLVTNAKGILCHLQQMMLCKEIFDHEPKLLEDFKTEVTEREGLVIESDQPLPREVRDEIVTEVTKIWYADIFRECKYESTEP